MSESKDFAVLQQSLFFSEPYESNVKFDIT